MKNKILVLSTAYNRPNTEAIFHKFAHRIYEDHGAETLLVNSGTDINLSFEKGVSMVNWANEPLSNKWAYGLSLTKRMDWDYLLILGSDDIMSDGCFHIYDKYIDQGYDMVCWKDIYFYHIQKKHLKYWAGYEGEREGESIGAGRLIKREVIEGLDYKLWDEGMAYGLDGSMSRRLAPLNLKTKILSLKETKEFMVDIKSEKNVSPFNSYTGDLENPNEVFKAHLPEADAILKLKQS